jgi:hypothetical protein
LRAGGEMGGGEGEGGGGLFEEATAGGHEI